MYKVSQSTGKTQVWSAWVEGDSVVVEHGELGGKLQLQRTASTPKNQGRSNATTAEEQALLEVKALYEDRYTNKHYRYTEEEAEVLASQCREPRKIHNYKDHSHKLPDEVYVSAKLNGSRACIINGELFSKIGRKEEIKVEHIRKAVEAIPNFTADCEVYAHGLSLQRIRSAWLKPVKTDKEIIKIANDRRKALEPSVDKITTLCSAVKYLGYNPNEDAEKLQLWVFDVPKTGMCFEDRWSKVLLDIRHAVDDLHLQDSIKIVWTTKVNKSEVLSIRDSLCNFDGYEGCVVYDPDDMYEFGKRSYTCQKSKPRPDSEALVVNCTEDKLGQGVLHLQTNEEMGGVSFKAKMKGTAEDRAFNLQKEFIGSWVTYSYEELSDAGKPTKPVVHEQRICNKQGKPEE